MVQAWCDDTPTQYEGICFLYVKFCLYTQPWAIRLGVKIITLSETKICIPITFIWELPPLSGADTERDGNKLHVHVVVSMVDETTPQVWRLYCRCSYGQRHRNEWQKRDEKYQEREVQRLLQSWFKTTCIVFYNNISAGHTEILL